MDGDLKAVFHIGREVIARRSFETGMQADADHFLPALESQSLIVVVGDSTLGMDEVGKLGGGEPEARPVAVRLDDIERLPTHWCGYEGVDAVVLSTSRPEIYRQLAANNARVQALDQWVRMGGRLVLCVGSQADEILAQNSPLGQFAPGRLEKMVSLRETGALETYAGSRVGGVGGRRRQGGDASASACRRSGDRRGRRVRPAVGGPHGARLRPGDLRGRRSRSAAAGEMVRPAAAGGQTARPAHRSRRRSPTKTRP